MNNKNNLKLKIEEKLDEEYDVKLVGEYRVLDFEYCEPELQVKTITGILNYLKETDDVTYYKVLDQIEWMEVKDKDRNNEK